MSRRSLHIKHKLDQALMPDTIVEHFEQLFTINTSPARFKDQRHFNDYLTEGSLLNITSLASKSLSIPSGEYMVWVTDVGHTMLVPTQQMSHNTEVFENATQQYEIATPDLLQNWNQIERIIEEDKSEPPEEHKFTPQISGVKRKAMFRAMQNYGYDRDYGALADKVGVQTPMISRILSGDRTPSMGTASQICDALNSDPTAIFPDIFNVQHGEKSKPKQVKGNRGSGMKGAAAGSVRKGKATEKWTQGNTKSESVDVALQMLAELDDTINQQIDQDMGDMDKQLTNQLQDQQNQIDKKEEERRKKLTPQLDQMKKDIGELSTGIDKSTQGFASSSEELENVDEQLDAIDLMIQKISSQL